MQHLRLLVKWNGDEILSVIVQFLWTLKFIFSSSHEKLLSVLFQVTIYIFSFKKMWKKGL